MENTLTQATILAFLSQNKAFLQKEFYVKKIGLFGSFAQNTSTADSDIDILVETDYEYIKSPFLHYEQIQDFFQAAFQRKVDIAEIKYIKPYAKQHLINSTIFV